MTTEVTKEQFESFVRVQRSGVVNMLSPQVQSLANISKEVHTAILNEYSALKSKYSS